MTRAIVVASAAPRASILGAPSIPKMNTALNTMFSITAAALIQALGVTWSVTFIIAI